jgi:hypothetical protein
MPLLHLAAVASAAPLVATPATPTTAAEPSEPAILSVGRTDHDHVRPSSSLVPTRTEPRARPASALAAKSAIARMSGSVGCVATIGSNPAASSSAPALAPTARSRRSRAAGGAVVGGGDALGDGGAGRSSGLAGSSPRSRSPPARWSWACIGSPIARAVPWASRQARRSPGRSRARRSRPRPRSPARGGPPACLLALRMVPGSATVSAPRPTDGSSTPVAMGGWQTPADPRLDRRPSSRR